MLICASSLIIETQKATALAKLASAVAPYFEREYADRELDDVDVELVVIKAAVAIGSQVLDRKRTAVIRCCVLDRGIAVHQR